MGAGDTRRSGVYARAIRNPPAPEAAVGYLLEEGRSVPPRRGIAVCRITLVDEGPDVVHCRVIECGVAPTQMIRRNIEEAGPGAPPLVLCGRLTVELAGVALRSRVLTFGEDLGVPGALDVVATEASSLARDYLRRDPQACLAWASTVLADWVGDALGPTRLTPRQRTIVALAALGSRRADIAAALDSQVKRIDTHIGEILARTRQQSLEAVARPFAEKLAAGAWDEPADHRVTAPSGRRPV